MPDLWMPGAARLDIGDHAPTDGGPAKCIAHITWDRNASAAAPQDLVPFETLQSYFGENASGRAVAPHILWDPFRGLFAQFVPANSRSKSLADQAGGTRTNRAGSVVIQVETVFFPYCRYDGHVYPRLVDTPCYGWPDLLAWVRSWGVPDVWPMGRPTSFAPNRSEAVWESQAGWYGHSQVPENDHQDPGSWPEFAAGGGGGSSAEVPVISLSALLVAVRRDVAGPTGRVTYPGYVEYVERALVAEGLLAEQYHDGSYGTKTVEAYAAWQRRLGYSGADADGIPGKTSLSRLGAAHGFQVVD